MQFFSYLTQMPIAIHTFIMDQITAENRRN